MITKEQYLANLTERIPVEKFPVDYAGYKRWTYLEDTLGWDQVSINGKRYMLTIENLSHGNPPTTTQGFWWWYCTGPIDNPTGSVDVNEIPDDVAADSLYGLYNPPEEPTPPVQAAVPMLMVILALGLLFSAK